MTQCIVTSMNLKLVLLFCLLLVAVIAAFITIPSGASATGYGGTYTSWPTTWTPISGLNDPDDGLSNERLDFVGDATDPCGYYAGNSDYLFFRVRVDDGAAATFSDTIMILIDNDSDGAVEYAFMWDSQSNDQTQHGLELGVPRDIGATWATSRMEDRDGPTNQAAKVAPPDFGVSNGDGYVRVVSGQSTTNFGTTTFVDYAVKWSYLSANSLLGKNQSWGVQFGSIDNANDHNWIDYDVAGGRTPTQSVTFPGSVGFSPTAVTLNRVDASNPANSFRRQVILTGLLFLLCVVGLTIGLSYLKSRA